ncbi:hypothetical protein E2C01_044920 [Portunus trituberculatus]|uniref:Uncharacterized protein n=1 Tax=Portunus trituberculatus TaxID=210409 RepID=A0A5B7G1F8_PORTR|nr:hypothetical protein [Portunus trituberculatus]
MQTHGKQDAILNLFSTMTRVNIYSAYYMVILHRFRSLCGD